MYGTYKSIRAYLYKLMDCKSGTDKERVKYFARFTEGFSGELLDVGCGFGELIKVIPKPERFSLIVGADLKKSHNKKYCHVTTEATKLALESEIFSLVTAFSLYEHVPLSERDDFLQEVWRVMKADGTFLIQLPNRYALVESHTFLPLFGFLPSPMHQFAYRDHYVSVPSLKTVIYRLEMNGFTVYDIGSYYAPFLPFGKLFKKIGLLRLFPMGYVILAWRSPENKRPKAL